MIHLLTFILKKYVSQGVGEGHMMEPIPYYQCNVKKIDMGDGRWEMGVLNFIDLIN